MKKNKIKKMFITLFALIVFLCLYMLHYNNNPTITISSLVKKGNLTSGDLVYRMNLFGIIPVANAIFKAQGQHLIASVSPLGSLQRYFNAYAVLDSYIDPESHNPVLFKQKVVIPGKQAVSKEVSYDQKNRTMTIGEVRRQILPDTQDPLSIMLNIRKMNFTNIKNLEMNINTNQKNYIFQVQITPQDISINNNKYKLFFLKAQIRRRDKNPYHKSKVDIVLVKNEQENIPVLIKIFASGFFISAKLIEIR